jgi:hypothetical protein
MHEIKVWHKKSRTKRFGKTLGLRHGNRIKEENNLFTFKKNRGIKSVLFSRVKRRISNLCLKACPPDHRYMTMHYDRVIGRFCQWSNRMPGSVSLKPTKSIRKPCNA